jgi:hypothetical protein
MQSQKVLPLFALALFALFCFTGNAAAQVKIVDACNFPTICIKLTPSSGGPGQLSEECWGLPILEDGWTESEFCLGPNGDFLELETYLFKATADPVVIFVEKMKLVPDLVTGATAYMVVEDIFLLRCNPASGANPNGEDFSPGAVPPLLLLDDVTFPTITVSEQEGPVEFLCAVFVPTQLLVDFFGPGLPIHLDWFACADMDSLGTFYGQPASPDVDGNGCPDSCFEVTPGASPLVQRIGLDEKGAGAINFFLNRVPLGLTRIDVFEPQPSSLIPPILPGMSAGESHNTRPWCFTIDQ